MRTIRDLSSEQRLRLFVEHAIDYGILLLDTVGNIAEWSPGAQQLLQWTPEEALNQTNSLIFTPEDVKAGSPLSELEIAKQHGLCSEERWHMRKDGSRIFAGSITRPIYDDAGVLIGFGKLIRNLTQRKVTLDMAARQARLLDLSYDAVLIWNFQSGRIVYWNKVAQERYGFTLEEATGSDSHALLATRFPDSLETIKTALFANSFWEGVLTHTTKSGKQIQVESRMVLRTDLEEDQLVLETNRDITHQKKAEEALRVSEERFRTLVTATSQVIWTTDPHGHIIEDSTVWRAFTGQTFDEYKGAGWLNALHPDDRERSSKIWANCVANKCVYRTEYRIRRSDGQYRWSAVRGVPVLNSDGSIREWIGANIDITERKLTEIDRQRFVLLAKYSTEFIGMADPELKPFFVNPAGLALVGLDSEAEALQMTVSDFFFPEDRSFILNQFFPKAMQEGTGEVEIRFRHFKTGEPIWVIYSVFALHDEDGKLIGHATISRNISQRKKMEQELWDTKARLESTLEAAEVATWIWNIQEDIMIPDRNLAKLFSLTDKEMIGAPIATYFTSIHQDDIEYLSSLIEHVIKTGDAFQPTFRIRTTPQEYHWVIGRGRVKYDERMVPITLSGVILDITRQKQAEEALRISNERLNLAIEGAGEGIWEWDVPNNKISFSGHFHEITGYSENELGNNPEDWVARIHPDDLQGSNLAMREHLEGKTPSYSSEYRIKSKSGEWKWVHSRGVLIERSVKGEPLRMAGIVADISVRKESEERIWHLANFDTLTSLPNRRLFRDRLNHEILNAQRKNASVALLFIDLDGFKHVNDLLGHDTGDVLLIQAAKRIKDCVRDNDTVARLGGDEFTVILGSLHQIEHLEQIAQKVLERLALPFPIGSERLFLSGSIGVSLYPEDANSAEELIRKADQAMYAAKHAGKNQFCYFTKDMDEKAHSRLRLLHELRNAIQFNQISVHYQPVVELKSGEIIKAEALIRWQHPLFGNVSPTQFIPLAEESGLVNILGDYVFKEAVAKLKHWKTRCGVSLQMSINKSPLQFRVGDGDQWLRYLKDLDMPPSCIVVEITEGLLLDLSENVSHELLKYRDAGIQVAIDDFGTGYSSMSYLQRFDIDYLKIDQSFVKDMETNDGNRTIAESMIVMAHKLGLQVIAEGIETKEQVELLRSAGCDCGQGYFFSKPLHADEFENLLLRENKALTPSFH